ncbi:hypothetical protein ACQEU5_14425 [Marinactinospora thermotolerans]|uniref:hypothetical protein n=1 Tax=Marinactinospora thermotolerans TaxID=531310 RepID=UPI003D9407BF
MPSIASPRKGLDSSGQHRRSHLTRLRGLLLRLGRPVVVALADSDHPVLYTTRQGRRVAVVVAEYGGDWWFLWDGGGYAPVDEPWRVTASLAPTARGETPAGIARAVRSRPRCLARAAA